MNIKIEIKIKDTATMINKNGAIIAAAALLSLSVVAACGIIQGSTYGALMGVFFGYMASRIVSTVSRKAQIA